MRNFCVAMGRIFITGAADGLGLLTAQALVKQGHKVVLHARNKQRGLQAKEKVPEAEAVVTGDLADIEETISLASAVNDLGVFDAVIHNAGVYQVSAEQIFAVNTLAPYILSCLIELPERLIYMTSGMHMQGQPNFDQFNTETTRITYSDSKLHVMMLSMAMARRFPKVYSNSVDPGWVPTRMGGKGAPDDLQEGYETQVWLATSNDAGAKVSGRYFHHKQQRVFNKHAYDVVMQEQLLNLCEEITGVGLV